MTTPKQIGKYQVLGEIASGAQGAVYRAFDPATAMTVAVKVLIRQSVTDVERLRREASLVQAIDHQNVVRLIEVGESEGLHFMVMEFIPETLSNLIEVTGALPVERAVALATGISDGLGYAHAQGIVHHDIKPQNVLLTPDGTPKVTDFGIARGEMLNTMTATGAMMGTPFYMSPEQANGERGDPRSDVYSLGCLLYQLLSGEVPFSGGSPLSVLRRHIEESPQPLKTRLSGIPAAVASCVEQAMSKDPSQRFADGNAFSAALQTALPSAITGMPDDVEVRKSNLTSSQSKSAAEVQGRNEIGVDIPDFEDPDVSRQESSDRDPEIEHLPESGSRTSFKDAVISGYKNTFDYKGRATRAEYWWWVLFNSASLFLAIVLEEVLGIAPNETDVGVLYYLVLLINIFPMFSLWIRRLHDVNRSGWWTLILFTYIGVLLLFYWAVKPTQTAK
jgi:serine/threonine protein kinase